MKLIQLITVDSFIFGLGDNGSFWEFDLRTRQWRRCPDASITKVHLDASIEELSVSKRTQKALYSHGLDTIGDLLQLSDEELADIPGIGYKSRYELENALAILQVG